MFRCSMGITLRTQEKITFGGLLFDIPKPKAVFRRGYVPYEVRPEDASVRIGCNRQDEHPKIGQHWFELDDSDIKIAWEVESWEGWYAEQSMLIDNFSEGEVVG